MKRVTRQFYQVKIFKKKYMAKTQIIYRKAGETGKQHCFDEVFIGEKKFIAIPRENFKDVSMTPISNNHYLLEIIEDKKNG